MLHGRLGSLPHQVLLLPAAAVYAFTQQPLSLFEWLRSPWENLDGHNEELWLNLFLGYMIKDLVSMPLTMSMLTFWVHHVASGIIAMTCLFHSPPCIFIVGGTLCELGSATQSYFYLSGLHRYSAAYWIHSIGMTVTNLGSVALVAFFMFGQTLTPFPARAFFSLVSLLMFSGRQMFCANNLRDSVEQSKSGGGVGVDKKEMAKGD